MKTSVSNKTFKIFIAAICAAAIFCTGMFSYPYVHDVYNYFQSSLVKKDDYVFYNAVLDPFQVEGFAFMEQNDNRLNRLIADKHYSDGVDRYAQHTAGGRVRFSTDSPSFCIKAEISDSITMPYHTEYGSVGMDVYLQNDEGRTWMQTLVHGGGVIQYHTSDIVQYNTFIVTLPQYAVVEKIQIGIEKGYGIAAPQYDYAVKDPIVFYGSSITQGAAASRTGTSFPFLVADYFNADYLNFGFSGSAKGEQSVAQDIASIQMSAFVMEYDHNADTVGDLKETHYDFYKAIRDANPDIPIVMISRLSGGYFISETEAQQRVEVIKQTYERAVSEGDDNLFFIDGSRLRDKYGADCLLADGKHPNDYGMWVISRAVIEKLRGNLAH